MTEPPPKPARPKTGVRFDPFGPLVSALCFLLGVLLFFLGRLLVRALS